MASARERKRHVDWLATLTALPTAAGREQRVIAWVRDWVARRDDLRVRADAAGNLIIERRGRRPKRAPVYVTAHLDHPAFVVHAVEGRRVELEFRGGVHPPYFDSARITIYDDDDGRHSAVVESLDFKARPFKRVVARLTRKTDALAPGDVGRWTFPRGGAPVTRGTRFHTPACDDLAAVAAALSMLDQLRGRPGMGHVRVLLTRAEEVGFVGTLRACKDGTIEREARLICLENSRSFAESPLGAGPILRVGDKSSVFMPDLTNRIADIMNAHAARTGFKWQRKLMPGGSCEATAFSVYGFQSTCICLPLENYHNMHDIDGVLAGKRPAKPAMECIDLDDYHGMIEMLVLCTQQLDTTDVPPMRARLDTLLDEVGHVLES
jgi:endoglucanase